MHLQVHAARATLRLRRCDGWLWHAVEMQVLRVEETIRPPRYTGDAALTAPRFTTLRLRFVDLLLEVNMANNV